MKQKTYSILTGVIFLVIAVLHFCRIVNRWDAMIGNLFVPMWASWIALLLAAFLAFQGLRAKK